MLRTIACRAMPHTASPAPTKAASTTRGARTCQTIASCVALAPGPISTPVRCSTSTPSTRTGPMLTEPTPTASTSAAHSAATRVMIHRTARRRLRESTRPIREPATGGLVSCVTMRPLLRLQKPSLY